MQGKCNLNHSVRCYVRQFLTTEVTEVTENSNEPRPFQSSRWFEKSGHVVVAFGCAAPNVICRSP